MSTQQINTRSQSSTTSPNMNTKAKANTNKRKYNAMRAPILLTAIQLDKLERAIDADLERLEQFADGYTNPKQPWQYTITVVTLRSTINFLEKLRKLLNDAPLVITGQRSYKGDRYAVDAGKVANLIKSTQLCDAVFANAFGVSVIIFIDTCLEVE